MYSPQKPHDIIRPIVWKHDQEEADANKYQTSEIHALKLYSIQDHIQRYKAKENWKNKYVESPLENFWK